MDMTLWLKDLKRQKNKKAMPILSFPGVQLLGISVKEMVTDGNLQAKCIKAIADRYDTLASVCLMDLSVEAEAFGSPVIYSDIEVPTVTAKIIETKEDAESLAIPKVGDARTGEYVKAANKAKALIKDRPVFAGHIGPFSLAGRLFGMTDVMLMSLTEPDTVKTVLEKCTRFLIEYAKAYKDAGADGLIIAEPAAGLLSPDLNNEFSVAYIRQIIDSVQDGSFIIIYHNCGNTMPLVLGILQTGAKIFHFGNSVNIEKILEIMPSDYIVMGNVDPSGLFRIGTQEQVAARTGELMQLTKKYSNYIISSGCDIPVASPLKNIDAFFEAVKTSGQNK